MTELRIQTTPHFLPLFDKTHPEAGKMFKVFRGGRGGMKSWQIARSVLKDGADFPHRIICGREYQNALADSVKTLLEEQSVAMQLDRFYRPYESEIIGRHWDGKKTEIAFKGMKQNINSLKSFEGCRKLWLEEAHTTSQKSIDVVFPTIRAPGAEFIFSYNPELDDDPIHKFVNALPKDLVYIAEVNADDNPWLPESLRVQKEMSFRQVQEAESDEERAVCLAAYEHTWLGKTIKNSFAQIFAGKCSVAGFIAVKDEEGNWRIDGHLAEGPYYGADWGFSTSPDAFVKCWIANNCLYVEYEVYKYRLDLDDKPAAFREIPGLEFEGLPEGEKPDGLISPVIRADCARPETISHMRKRSFNILAVEKWPDSIVDGITVLKSFKKIIIHQRCRNMQNEARLYSYKVDAKTGDILRDIVDKYNDLWDAVRYALAPFIKRSGKGRGFFEYSQRLAEKNSAPPE